MCACRLPRQVPSQEHSFLQMPIWGEKTFTGHAVICWPLLRDPEHRWWLGHVAKRALAGSEPAWHTHLPRGVSQQSRKTLRGSFRVGPESSVGKVGSAGLCSYVF